MKVFTYKDYIRCIHTLRLNAVFKLAEKSNKYTFTKEKEYEKIIKKVLEEDAKEMECFINNFLEPKKKINYKNLIKYNNGYIHKKYMLDEKVLVYKLKNEEIFFLVEEVEKLDNIVLYEILNYCISIMQEWNLTNKKHLESKEPPPIIVPILIYTGIEKVRFEYSEKNKKIGDYIFKNYNIKLNYNLINISKLPVKILIKISNCIGYAILLERAKNKKDFMRNVNMIIDSIDNDKKMKKLKKVLDRIPEKLLTKEEREKIL